MNREFLPISAQEMLERGIQQLDFVYVIGDAYVDHPSFGAAIISRLLEAHGYTVGIISQPDWRDPKSVTVLGEPRLAFLVTAGNMDSMVNHYTVSRKHRQADSYTPGGVTGKRPDRAAMVYCNLIRQTYKKTPVIAGGIEASLRRLAHYDYWSDSLRRSLLMDCGADLISYGMGERSILEIADSLAAGIPVSELTYLAGTCFRTKNKEDLADCEMLPSYEELLENRETFAKSFYRQYVNTDPFSGKRLAEQYGTVYVVQNPPSKPLSREEMDEVYSLPYCRTCHPSYEAAGGVPALAEVKFSLVSSRGCFGGCSFCSLTFHQGRIVQSRSQESLLAEAREMTKDPDFKGYIHDVGGPTANFRFPSCEKQLRVGVCKNRQCLFPTPCKNLQADHSEYVELLRKLRSLPGVKKVFIRSGIRFDYLLCDPSREFLRELVEHHVSGQLKVAPEHVSARVLAAMGKPPHEVYERFVQEFTKMNRDCGKDQYLVPYLMSSHPGCTMRDAVTLAEYLRDTGHAPEQVQDFYPTPSTMSTCMYYTGLDPRTMTPVYVPKNPHEKALQRALLQYRLPQNRTAVEEALRLAHREDLIGWGPKCLIRPEENYTGKRGDFPPRETKGEKSRRVSRDKKTGGKSTSRKGTGGKEKGTANRRKGRT